MGVEYVGEKFENDPGLKSRVMKELRTPVQEAVKPLGGQTLVDDPGALRVVVPADNAEEAEAAIDRIVGDQLMDAVHRTPRSQLSPLGMTSGKYRPPVVS